MFTSKASFHRGPNVPKTVNEINGFSHRAANILPELAEKAPEPEGRRDTLFILLLQSPDYIHDYSKNNADNDHRSNRKVKPEALFLHPYIAG